MIRILELISLLGEATSDEIKKFSSSVSYAEKNDNFYEKRVLHNINVNFRNFIHITCSVCKNKKGLCCGDILVSFDKNGAPVFISVADANCIFATLVDKSECLCEISNRDICAEISTFKNKRGI